MSDENIITLSKESLKVLSNLNKLNSSILITEGDYIYVKSDVKGNAFTAKVKFDGITWPVECILKKLSGFLKLYDKIKCEALVFNNDHILLESGKSKAAWKYEIKDDDMMKKISVNPDKFPTLDNSTLKYKIKLEPGEFNMIMSSMNLLGSAKFTILQDGNIQGTHIEHGKIMTTKDSFQFTPEVVVNELDRDVHISIDDLIFVDGEYDFEIHEIVTNGGKSIMFNLFKNLSLEFTELEYRIAVGTE